MTFATDGRWRTAVTGRLEIARLTWRAGAPLVLAAIAVNAALGLLPVAFAVLISEVLGGVPEAVRQGVDSTAWGSLVALFLTATGLLLAQQVLAPAQLSLGEVLARRVDGRLFERLMSASLRSPGVGPLEDAALLGELNEAKQQLGFQSAGGACAGLLGLVARYLQLVGFTVAAGVLFSWTAALGLLTVVLMFRQGQRGGLRRYSVFLRQAMEQRRGSEYLRELATSAKAAKEIRLFGLADWLGARYRESYLSWMTPLWAHRRRIYLRPYYWYTAFGLAVVAVVLVALGAAAARGGLGLGQVALVLQAVVAVVRLGDHYPESDVQTQYGMNALTAAREFERGVERHQDRSGQAVQDPPEPRGAIRFDRVGFRYAGASRAVFDGLDLEIPIGKCTAVVGLNGTGKTTLVKLLARLQDPTSGAVRVDGVDLRALDVHQWRRRLGVIFQDYLRHETTMAENIAFGAVEHADDRLGVEEAARAAGLGEVLAGLPNGLDTPLAAHVRGGVDLSGGQWQRVALARALFAVRHGASVLVLDEPTASLDVRAEARFYDEFVSLTSGLTTILVSHRFATVRLADCIVVLEHGRVLEQGGHDELISAGGRYAELFGRQIDRFAGEAKVSR